MSDELNEIVDNIAQPSAWIRIVLMAVFAIASYFVLLPFILVLSIAQSLFTLITGKCNANLRYFSATLELYFSQLFKFMTYLSDVKPYPFSNLPEVGDDSLEEESTPKKTNGVAKDEVKVSPASTGAAKPAAMKKAAPKKAAKKTTPKTTPKKAPKKTSKITKKPEKDTDGDGVSDS